eukprot:m.285376 g.285376  ORF g.285376 m.285376 type:complete len:305 (+) comp11362_c0_seq1:4713-5627(+)
MPRRPPACPSSLVPSSVLLSLLPSLLSLSSAAATSLRRTWTPRWVPGPAACTPPTPVLSTPTVSMPRPTISRRASPIPSTRGTSPICRAQSATNTLPSRARVPLSSATPRPPPAGICLASRRATRLSTRRSVSATLVSTTFSPRTQRSMLLASPSSMRSPTWSSTTPPAVPAPHLRSPLTTPSTTTTSSARLARVMLSAAPISRRTTPTPLSCPSRARKRHRLLPLPVARARISTPTPPRPVRSCPLRRPQQHEEQAHRGLSTFCFSVRRLLCHCRACALVLLLCFPFRFGSDCRFSPCAHLHS